MRAEADRLRATGSAVPHAGGVGLVRQLTGILAQDGGFVFTAVHNIMGDVPAQNIVAMYDEARACGRSALAATAQ